MNPLTCLIVDDEPLARNLLTEYVRKTPFLKLEKACSSPLEAIEILHRQPPDILFLDVQMPEITGIGLLKSLSVKPYVILTTAYSEYALEGYELDVMDYLLKPITFERFLKAAERALSRKRPAAAEPTAAAEPAAVAASEARADYIFVKDGLSLVKVRLADILYVEGMKDYVAIHTPAKKVVTLLRLKNLEQMLPADRFARIHHSYIVAFDWIEAVHKEWVQVGKAQLPISATYQKPFRDFIDGKTMS